MAEFIPKINWVDILVVILLIRSSYVGFTRGLGGDFLNLVGHICAAFGAIYYYEFIAQLLSDYFPAAYTVSGLISFTTIYILILIIFKFINIIIDKIIRVEIVSAIEKIGGLLFGFFRGCILISLLLISLMLTPFPYFEKSIKERSYMGAGIARCAPFLYEKVSALFPALKFGQRNEALLDLTGYKKPSGGLKGDKAKNQTDTAKLRPRR